MIKFKFTCSGLKGGAERAVARAVGRLHGKVVNAATFQAFDDAGWVGAVAVQRVSNHGLGAAKVFHSTLAGVPRQDGRVAFTVNGHRQVRGLAGHCEGRDRGVNGKHSSILSTRSYKYKVPLIEFYPHTREIQHGTKKTNKIRSDEQKRDHYRIR